MPYEANYDVFEAPAAPEIVEVSYGFSFSSVSFEGSANFISRLVGTTESARWTWFSQAMKLLLKMHKR